MTDLRSLALELVVSGCVVGLAGCAVATVWDVGKTVMKIPFMLGKGVYDVMTEEPLPRRGPALAPVVESPALAPPQVVRAPARAQEPVAVTYPVSPMELPEVRN